MYLMSALLCRRQVARLCLQSPMYAYVPRALVHNHKIYGCILAVYPSKLDPEAAARIGSSRRGT